MSKPISVQQWAEYLNEKTRGFSCPICGQNRWQTQQDEKGDVCDVRILDHSHLLTALQLEEIDGMFDAVNAGREITKPSAKSQPSTILRSTILVRCGHCGWIGLFDREFVEKELNDEER